MAPQVVQYPRATSLTAHSSRAVGVEVAGGAGGINPIGNVQPDRQDSTRSEGVDSSRSGVRLTATSIFVNAGAKKPLATPTGGGEAWPDNQPTRRATHQRPGAAGEEGAGGRKRAWLRCPLAMAGHGQTTSQRTSHISATRCRRCGGCRRVRRARAGFEINHSEPQARVWRSRGRPGPTAPRTPAAPQATSSIANSGCAAGADGSRAGRRPRAHKAARPTGQHVRRPEHQRRHKHHRTEKPQNSS